MFSETTDGDLIFTVLITRQAIDTAKPEDVALLSNSATSLHKKLSVLASLFEGVGDERP